MGRCDPRGADGAGEALIEREGVAVDAIAHAHEADFQYQGQTHVMRMPCPAPGFDPRAVLLAFEAMYRARFDVDLSEMTPMLSALRTTVIGRRTRGGDSTLGSRPGSSDAPPHSASQAERGSGDDGARPHDRSQRSRAVWFDGSWHETPILDRAALHAGETLAGPAIVEQLDATTVIEPRDRAHVDPLGNLVIELR